MKYPLILFVLAIISKCDSINVLKKLFRPTTEDPESWTGRWMPERVKTSTEVPSTDVSDVHGRNMGNKDTCDDGETNLSTDWDGDHRDFLCMNPRNRININEDIEPIVEYENIPKAYEPPHMCMNESINYQTPVPTYGPHRQLWPVYGDYKYLPAQRWLHSIEHGAIVVLYHPCADPMQIKLLKKYVQGCLRRYVSTPWASLSKKRPFALVAWGVRIQMNHVSSHVVMNFIQEHALNGPEHVSRNGQYNHKLLSPAQIVSDEDDSQLCPVVLAHD